jgi:hypothetical protein
MLQGDAGFLQFPGIELRAYEAHDGDNPPALGESHRHLEYLMFGSSHGDIGEHEEHMDRTRSSHRPQA